MSYRFHTSPNRTVCSVLEEIRTCNKTRNYSPLLGLIEEVQTLANRMEAALHDLHDIEYLREEKKKLKKELAKLEKKIESNKE